MRVCMYVCMYVCVYVMYVCVCVFVYVYVYIKITNMKAVRNLEVGSHHSGTGSKVLNCYMLRTILIYNSF